MKKCHVMAIQKRTLVGIEDNFNLLERTIQSQTERFTPDLVLLPEMFACPYENEAFPVYAAPDGGEVYERLSGIAKKNGFYLIGGSVPECDSEGRIYNTSYVFDREGCLIAKHRKVHLFDIDVPGGQYFRESDTLSPGEGITVFDTEFCRMGVCICFDVRFAEMFLEMRRAGVSMVLIPAAFNMTTGPAHWETLFKARALDAQAYVLGCSPARDTSAGYTAYGHTILTDPWGQVIKELDEKEGVLTAVIDPEYAMNVRQQIPLEKLL